MYDSVRSRTVCELEHKNLHCDRNRYDEVHNICGKEPKVDDEIAKGSARNGKILIRTNKSEFVLSLTATPKVFGGDKSGSENIVSCDDVKLFGEEILYQPKDGSEPRRYTWKDAIEDRVVVPVHVHIQYWTRKKKREEEKSSEKDVLEILDDENILLGDYVVDGDEFAMISAAVKAISSERNSHSLFFHNKNIRTKRVKEFLVKYLKVKGLDIKVYRITGDTKRIKREEVFRQYVPLDTNIERHHNQL